MDSIKKNIVFVMFTVIAVVLVSCSSSDTVKNLTAEDRFELGKMKFYSEDYQEAINEFEIIKLQFTASAVADSSQYFLAECHLIREEYLLAADEYQTLRRNFPTSMLVPTAQYKIALCYYNLSPSSVLEQKYTLRAIDELQGFIEYYPKHELVAAAAEKIQDLNTRLAKKEFDTAELYMKLEYFKSATFYYNSIVEKYHDTQYAEPALFGKIKALVSRKRYSEAKPEVEKFLEKYPQTKFKTELDSLYKEIDKNEKYKS